MEKEFEILNTADDYIENIKIGIEELVSKINSGEENNGLKLISPVIDGVEWLINAINLTKDFHKGKISIKNTNDILAEMIEALENQDYVLIGDLFQYELLPIVEKIQSDIKEVILN